MTSFIITINEDHYIVEGLTTTRLYQLIFLYKIALVVFCVQRVCRFRRSRVIEMNLVVIGQTCFGGKFLFRAGRYLRAAPDALILWHSAVFRRSSLRYG